MVYLDNAATTMISDKALGAYMATEVVSPGNPGAPHSRGRRAKQIMDAARRQVADLIGAAPENIVFTSGGSEANNLVIGGIAEYLKGFDYKGHIVLSAIEHESLLNAAANAKHLNDMDVTIIGVDSSGRVSLEEVSKAIRDNTWLVSVMHTNNETGIMNPVAEIGKLCQESGVFFHTDCVQALGSSKINVDELNCDFLSISSHKIHGCKGMGALYVRDLDTISPLIHGGKNQEFGLRGGTENVPAIAGFGEACADLNEHFEERYIHMREMKEMFLAQLERCFEKEGLPVFEINGDQEFGDVKTVNLLFRGVDAESLVLLLDKKYDVIISAGSACRSLESTPSYVLTSMGLSDSEARNSVRISFSYMTTIHDVLEAAEGIKNAVSFLMKCNEI